MKKNILGLILLSTLLLSCGIAIPTLPSGVLPSAGGVEFVKGQYTYSNDIIDIYYVEPAVSLLDMTGFVLRDDEWEMPVDSQVLGYLKTDRETLEGEFQLSLPIKPLGEFHDVDQDTDIDKGVQIFTIGYSPNLYGDPFAAGDDRNRGWPSYLATVKTDTENKDEVIGGQLIIWSPDEQQDFPSGFGADGLLFTADDPQMKVQAGYSVIDLDKEPFTIKRDREVSLTLYEPDDAAIKDFSKESYSSAFDKMFEIAKVEYAFNGIAGKEPDWDAAYKEVSALVKDAERSRSAEKYYQALEKFVGYFHDGHVGLNGGEIGQYLFFTQQGGGVGLAIRELADGRLIVVYILPESPADQQGIQVGAEITQVNGKPATQALEQVKPEFGPYSTDFGYRYDQAMFLFRGPIDSSIQFTYQNPGSTPVDVTLTRIQEFDSLLATYGSGDDMAILPVSSEVLEGSVGYISINSNYDDLNLIIRLFERALKKFTEFGVTGIIIDMRNNSGGADLGLAGFLTDEEIPMAKLEYYSSKTGQFEPEGDEGRILPNENQYRFDKMILLVGLHCYSACEIESYGFSQVPGMVVMGEYPTGGVEAEVARGQFNLPEGFSLQIPTGRFTLEDGSIFLEGVGVEPEIRVNLTDESILDGRDIVLDQAIQEILGN